MHRNVVVVEQDPLLSNRLSAAFVLSGYHVQATDNNESVLEMIRSGRHTKWPVDLVVVDITQGGRRGLVADLLSINASIPILTLKDAADKALIIEMLNKQRLEIIEQFIDSHGKA